MAEEKRWELGEPDGGPLVELTLCLGCDETTSPGSLGCNRDPNRGHTGPFRTVAYIPAEAAESKLAEVEGERDHIHECSLRNVRAGLEEGDRADKAEADLARVRKHVAARIQAIRTELDEFGFKASPMKERVHDELRALRALEDQLTASPTQEQEDAQTVRRTAREQPRYTVEEIRERLLETAKSSRGFIASVIDRAFPQPNTPTEARRLPAERRLPHGRVQGEQAERKGTPTEEGDGR